MRIVEELHAAGRVVGRGRRHRVDGYRGLAALKLIHRADPDAGWAGRGSQGFLDRPDLSIVRGYHQHVVRCEGPDLALPVLPGSAEQVAHQPGDPGSFLW